MHIECKLENNLLMHLRILIMIQHQLMMIIQQIRQNKFRTNNLWYAFIQFNKQWVRVSFLILIVMFFFFVIICIVTSTINYSICLWIEFRIFNYISSEIEIDENLLVRMHNLIFFSCIVFKLDLSNLSYIQYDFFDSKDKLPTISECRFVITKLVKWHLYVQYYKDLLRDSIHN